MSATAAAKEYWGYLVKPDKSPTPLLKELLLGLAQYIRKHVAPWEIHHLTPQKMAAFYKLVGGNFDSLFIQSSDSSIAFIYKSLGCFHSLQPTTNPFAGPSVPALTPEGFVRWQTVQLLLEPDMHVPFLQEAVKRFDIINPADGETFPRQLPSSALPRRPDPEMCRWEEGVRAKLHAEAQPLPGAQGTPRHASRVSDVESLNTESSAEDRSIVDAGDYFTDASPRRPKSHSNSRSPPRGHFENLNIKSSPQLAPQSSERRRSPPDRDEPTPTHPHPYSRPAPAPQPSPRSSSHQGRHTHQRNSSRSQSPGRYARRASLRPTVDAYGRRHSDQGSPRGPSPARGSMDSKRSTLSPPFYAPPAASNGSRPTSQAGAPYPGYTAQTAVPPGQYPPNQIPTRQQMPGTTTPPGSGGMPPQSGFAPRQLRNTVGHGYRGPSGDWRAAEKWAQHNRGPPPTSNGQPDASAVRFADEDVPRSSRGRRLTMEEIAREREREEMEFEKTRRRERKGSSSGRSRDRWS